MYATGLDDSFGATEMSFKETRDTITSPYRQNTQPAYEDLEREYNRLRVVNFNLKLSLVNMEESLQELELGPEVADLVLANAQLKSELKTRDEETRRLQRDSDDAKAAALLRDAAASSAAASAAEDAAAAAAARCGEEAAHLRGQLAAATRALAELRGQAAAAEGRGAQAEAQAEAAAGEAAEEAAELRRRCGELLGQAEAARAEARGMETRAVRAEAALREGEEALREEAEREAAGGRRAGQMVRKLEDDLVDMEAEVPPNTFPSTPPPHTQRNNR